MDELHAETLLRPGGRRVAAFQLAASDSGRTVVLCHPAPGAGRFDPDPEQTREHGVTLLGLSRPGYGQSDPLPEDTWPSLATLADDIAALLEQRGITSAGIAGWSAGGRVALALAARRPDLVERVVVLATPAPQEAVPWVAPEQHAAVEQLRGESPATARRALEALLAPLIPERPGDERALELLALSEADGAALSRAGARERLDLMLGEAFAQGAAGLAADIATYSLRPWGFSPQEVRAKTLLLYGSGDPMAGPRHGAWWQRHLPEARLEVVPDAGHLLIAPAWGQALSFLRHTQDGSADQRSGEGEDHRRG